MKNNKETRKANQDQKFSVNANAILHALIGMDHFSEDALLAKMPWMDASEFHAAVAELAKAGRL